MAYSGGVKLKYKYSQVFLTNNIIAESITKVVNITGKNVLEIGPGHGFLTQYIWKETRKLLMIEKDVTCQKFLKQYNIQGNIIFSDILQIDLTTVCNSFFDYSNFYCFGNLPYNISSQIIFNLCKINKCNILVLMVQKEFGEKLKNKSNFYSLYIKYFFEIEQQFIVKKIDFNPVPAVDSTVLLFKRIKQFNQDIPFTSAFVKFLKSAFLYKRKKMLNNIADSSGKIKNYLNEENISENVRSENLSLKQFIKIYNILYNNEK